MKLLPKSCSIAMIVASLALPVFGQAPAFRTNELPESHPAPADATPSTSTASTLPGLISQWRGEGDATDSVGRNDGAWVGTASYGPGACGQAFVFDGSSYVEAGSAGLPTGDSDRTLALWVRIDAFVAEEVFFAGYGGFGNGSSQTYHLGATGVTGVTELFFSQWGDGVGTSSVRPGQWCHVAVSNEGSRVHLYLNGTLVGTRALRIQTPGETRFYIGKIAGQPGDIRRLQGSVDEISLYARALSAGEIRELFKMGFGGDAENAVPAFTMKERSVIEAGFAMNEARDLWTQGHYKEAIPFDERAVELYEKAWGPHNLAVVTPLYHLSQTLRKLGEYEKARLHLLRATAILEKPLGSNEVPSDVNVKDVLHLLGIINFHMGQYASAEAIFQRELAIFERDGPNHPYSARPLVALANVMAVNGDDVKAEPLYLKALAFCESCWRPDDLHFTDVLNSLSMLYCRRGEYEKSEQMALRSQAIYEKQHGPESPDVCAALGPLGTVYKARGQYAKAREAYRRGLALLENAFGLEHPEVAVFLTYLAEVSQALGDSREALTLFARAEEVRERNIALNISIGSAGQKLGYIAQYARDVDSLVSFNMQAAPSDPGAARLALTTILRRKARALDAAADSLATIRRHASPADRALLDELEQTRTQLAGLVLQGIGSKDRTEYRDEVARLEQHSESLESAISSHSAEFRVQSTPVTVEGVQAEIPADAALVEFVRYEPCNPGTVNVWGAPRYVAYVLTQVGEPRCVDLGYARRIDDSVERFRAAVGDSRRRDVKALGRTLDELVMRPVRGLLKGETRLLLSPDGALNLVPFVALVDEQSRFLVETFAITNVTSGRDLLRLREHVDSSEAPLVIADPDFYANGNDGAPPSDAARSVDITRLRFGRLRGSADEALALGRMLGNAVVLTKSMATKAALERAKAPTILHVATHGFFLEDEKPTASDTRRMELMRSGALRSEIAGVALRIENPLLRSGLALAGANRPDKGVRDGVLTALEASGLDLWGTQLVVLSACNTGVGEVKQGNGVYGLRRALVLAGAETQVVSLWAVADMPTRDLMVAYYRALLTGKGRGDAMREVQLESLASKARRHPAFWAGFIVSGDWRPLNLKLATNRFLDQTLSS